MDDLLLAFHELTVRHPKADPDTCATYVTLNSRDIIKASLALKEYIDRHITQQVRNTERNWDQLKQSLSHTPKQWITELAKHPQKQYFNLDIDNLAYLPWICQRIIAYGITPELVLQTHSGYHIVIRNDDCSKSDADGKRFGQVVHVDIAKTLNKDEKKKCSRTNGDCKSY